MTLGGYDLNQFASGPLTWHDAIKGKPYWMVESQQMTFGNETIFTNFSTIVDTGTSYLMVPHAIGHKLMSQVKAGPLKLTCHLHGSITVVIYCTRPAGMTDAAIYSQFPSMNITIDGRTYHLPA